MRLAAGGTMIALGLAVGLVGVGVVAATGYLIWTDGTGQGETIGIIGCVLASGAFAASAAMVGEGWRYMHRP